MASVSSNVVPPIADSTFSRETSFAIRRRPLSIFSRKGNETPVSERAGPASMRFVSRPTDAKAAKAKPKRKSAPAQGTILRAVPAAVSEPLRTPPSSTFSPAALQLAMVTDPNEEILTAIGRPSPPPTQSVDDMMAFHSLPHFYDFKTNSPATSPTRNNFPRKQSVARSRAPVIGRWSGGQVQWDNEPKVQLVSRASDAFLGQTARTQEADQSAFQLQDAPRKEKPRIQVIIPHDQRNRPFPQLPFFAPPVSHPKSSSVKPESAHTSATASATVSGIVSPPSVTGITSIRSSMVSPMTTTVTRPQPRRLHTLERIDQEQEVEVEQPKKSRHQKKPSSSSSDSGHSEGDNDSSNYSHSKRSSMTSIDSKGPEIASLIEGKPISLHSRSNSIAYSTQDPVASGVFDDTMTAAAKSAVEAALANLTVTGAPRPLRTPPPPPTEEQRARSASPPSERTRTPPLPRMSSKRMSRISKRPSTKYIGPPSIRLEVLEQAIAKEDFLPVTVPRPASVTLSQAEHDLEAQLTAMTEEPPIRWEDFGPNNPLMKTLPPVPVPRKSSKRLSMIPKVRNHAQQLEERHRVLSMPPSRKGSADLLSPKSPVPEAASPADTMVGTLSPVKSKAKVKAERDISPEAAEQVILHILQSITDLDDLFSTAVVNKGFYRVFKRHELPLMRSSLFRMSPAAWEFREICPPTGRRSKLMDDEEETPIIEYTPTTYLKMYVRDMYIIGALKSLILERCQSFLRPETVAALSSSDSDTALRMDAVFWRIWTFCKIFGSGRGREDDIVGQMDWLRGGVLAHQETCRATVFSTDLDFGGVLLNAPECFAKGNPDGLSAEQLYDMTEIWNCLNSLLQPLHGETVQARKYGVYDCTEVRGGDIDGEEIMLEEWQRYLLTLGLSNILDLAIASTSTTSEDAVFILAAQRGHTTWAAPEAGNSRSNFLKEAVSRVYEEKVASMFSSDSPTVSSQQEMRERNKQRIAVHAAEIKKRKLSGDCKEIRMSQDRPMSEWEGVLLRLTRQASLRAAPPVPALPVMAELPEDCIISVAELPATTSSAYKDASALMEKAIVMSHCQSPDAEEQTPIANIHPALRSLSRRSRYTIMGQSAPASRKGSGSSSTYSQSVGNPLSEKRYPTEKQYPGAPSASGSVTSNGSMEYSVSAQHPLQQSIFGEDKAQNSADRAIYRIVEMGFTAEQARMALRDTDDGSGLRVDKAVETLLGRGL